VCGVYARSAIDMRRIVLPLCDVAVLVILSAGRLTETYSVQCRPSPWDVKAGRVVGSTDVYTESVFM